MRDRAFALVREQLHEDALAEAQKQGRELTVDNAVELALAELGQE
jgi:hypothetical protein